jgi:hypothetical protein
MVKRAGEVWWVKAGACAELTPYFRVNPDRGPTTRQRSGLFSPLARVTFSIGLLCFFIAHADTLLGTPPRSQLLFLATCAVWGAIFGIPVCVGVVYRHRSGLTGLGVLLFVAAALDVSVFVYRSVNQPQVTWTSVGSSIGAPANETKARVQPAAPDRLTVEERELIILGRRVKAATNQPALAGIGKSFRVSPFVSQDIREHLSESEVRTRVELRLRQFGLSITPNSPNCVLVTVNGVWNDQSLKTMMDTFIGVQLRNPVVAIRPTGSVSGLDATIWLDGCYGVSPRLGLAKNLEGGIDKSVDKLINEVLAANP